VTEAGGRLPWVILAVSSTVAIAGFFSGVSSSRPAAHAGRAEARAPSSAVLAAAGGGEVMPSYAELRELRRGDNGRMYAGAVAALVAPAPEPLAGPAKTEADWSSALAWRASRRAYAGAPPTIPHPIGQLAVNACLACHQDGATVGGRTAPLMGHARYESCVQCHVPSAGGPPGAAASDGGPPTLAPSAFAGLATFGRGGRAHAGAPPTIPHPTLMRSRCESCHGGKGLLGLRSPHLSRQSCTQCHAPSAVLEQRVALGERAR
jgi:cytochrome c-type protein NapB